MSRILITGGSGAIGTRLVGALNEKGHEVAIIGRSKHQIAGAESFVWNLGEETMDEAALDGVSHIVHLAGAGIADKPWSPSRKREIVESRVKPLQLLARKLSERNQRIDAIISSSATGYYGAVTSDKIFTEEDNAAQDFLGTTCKMWEQAVELFKPISDREVRIRTSVVLMKDAGALPKLATPVKYGVGAAVGSGNQWMPWIHVDDLVNLYVMAIENDTMKGAYNAAAPEHVDQTAVIKAIGKVLKRPVFLPPVPSFILKTVMGDMATVVTEGSRVSNERLTVSGFESKYKRLQPALTDLLT